MKGLHWCYSWFGQRWIVSSNFKTVQRKTQFGRGMQVPVHVPKRIYQNPLFRLVRSDQVGGVAESRIHEGFDKIIEHVFRDYTPARRAGDL